MTARIAVTPKLPTESDGTFETMVARLSQQSVDKHFSAYDDVAWDDPSMAIDPTDRRWELWVADPLAASDWYRGLPAEARARFGLHRIAQSLTVGWQFENLLQRGLLQYSLHHQHDMGTFRYLQHEIAEETQHTMMFREFVHRTGLEVRGMPKALVFIAERFLPSVTRHFPELFFVFVLGGEDPADYLQRRQLKEGVNHPLLETIMRIHVTEESRHLSFARHLLREKVPALSWFRRQRLAVQAPLILGLMARLMCYPGDEIVAAYDMPKDVLLATYGGEAGARLLRESVAKPRRLCIRLGLVTPLSRLLWRRARIWDDADVAAACVDVEVALAGH